MWPIAREGVVYHAQGGVATPREGYGERNPYEGQLSQHKGYGRPHRSDALIGCGEPHTGCGWPDRIVQEGE